MRPTRSPSMRPGWMRSAHRVRDRDVAFLCQLRPTPKQQVRQDRDVEAGGDVVQGHQMRGQQRGHHQRQDGILRSAHGIGAGQLMAATDHQGSARLGAPPGRGSKRGRVVRVAHAQRNHGLTASLAGKCQNSPANRLPVTPVPRFEARRCRNHRATCYTAPNWSSFGVIIPLTLSIKNAPDDLVSVCGSAPGAITVRCKAKCWRLSRPRWRRPHQASARKNFWTKFGSSG